MRNDHALNEPTIPNSVKQADSELTRIDRSVDWLHFLSPLNTDDMWDQFKKSGYRRIPELCYTPIPTDYVELKKDLQNLSLDDIEDPLLRALFLEKKSELALQADLVLQRNKEGFISLSLALFGGNDPYLESLAKELITLVTGEDNEEASVSSKEFARRAEKELNYYRSVEPNLDSKVKIVDDLNSQLMVYQGDLLIAKSSTFTESRVYPLIAHEVGTHIVTFYNGRQQALKLFEVGLAHYDSLQEGLATLSEYLTGSIPPLRLKTLAGRVLACKAAIEGRAIEDIFSELHDQYKLAEYTAFDIAVRACRGGGLTKDSVYLEGLHQLIHYLALGGDIHRLFAGKYALEQLPMIESLLEGGWLKPPALLPRHLYDQKTLSKLEVLRKSTIQEIFIGEI